MFCRQFALVGAAARPRVLHNLVNAPKSSKLFHRGSKKAVPSRSASSDGTALVLSNPLRWYSQKLDSHPLVTKCLTGCLILGNGDVLSQYIEGQETWDARRTLRFALIGLVFEAPALHYWYQYLKKVFPGRTTQSIAKRVLWDQLAFNPPYLVIFLTSVWAMEGKGLAEIPDLLKNTFPSAIIANWLVWTPAQIYTFGWVPSKYQVLATNVVALAWNAYLSYCSHEHPHHGPDTTDHSNDPTVVVLHDHDHDHDKIHDGTSSSSTATVTATATSSLLETRDDRDARPVLSS